MPKLINKTTLPSQATVRKKPGNKQYKKEQKLGFYFLNGPLSGFICLCECQQQPAAWNFCQQQPAAWNSRTKRQCMLHQPLRPQSLSGILSAHRAGIAGFRYICLPPSTSTIASSSAALRPAPAGYPPFASDGWHGWDSRSMAQLPAKPGLIADCVENLFVL